MYDEPWRDPRTRSTVRKQRGGPGRKVRPGPPRCATSVTRYLPVSRSYALSTSSVGPSISSSPFSSHSTRSQVSLIDLLL